MEKKDIHIPYSSWTIICKECLLMAIGYLFIYPAKLTTLPLSILWGMFTILSIIKILVVIHKDNAYILTRKIVYSILFVGIVVLSATNLYWDTLPSVIVKIIKLTVGASCCIGLVVRAFIEDNLRKKKIVNSNTTFLSSELFSIGVLYIAIVTYL